MLIFAFMLSITNSSAQQIQGNIIDAITLEPIQNAKVLYVGSEVVVFSDKQGFFKIEVDRIPAILEISATNYELKEVEINTKNSSLKFYLISTSELLSEVLVNGALIPNNLQKSPASISILTSKDLDKADNSNFAQIFNSVPGIYVNQGALNTTKLNIRGIGARSQFSTNRIQAYFNGIPLTTGEGDLTLDDLDAESISKIEIIKGPASSIFGAGLGGVINIFGKDAEVNKSELEISSQYGSFETLKRTISASHGTQKASIFTSFNDLESDGYRENGGYKRSSVFFNANVFTHKNNKLSFIGNYTKLKAFIPSSINEDAYFNDPTAAAFTWKQSKGYESYKKGLFGISYLHDISEKFSNLTSLYVNFRDGYEPRPFNILKEDRVATGVRTKFNLDLEIFNKNSQLSFGAEYYKEWYSMQTFDNLYADFEDQGSVQGNKLSDNDQDRKYANFFSQLNIQLSEKLNIETGFNLNSTKYSLKDQFQQDEIDQTGDYRFETIFSPRLGISYELASGRNLYASVSHGFSSPTVEETLTPEGLINTNLKTEQGVNYEIGFKGNWLNNSLYTEVAFYSIQIKNLLVAQRISEDQYVGINAGKSNHNGVELTLKYNLDLSSKIRIQPYFNSSFNYFEFEKFINRDQDFSGNILPGVPKSTINSGFQIQYDKKLSFYTNMLAVGEIFLNDANSLNTENYQVVDIKARYDFSLFNNFDANLSGGINNLLDEKYASSVLPNAVGFGGAAPRYYYPGNPRNYFVGAGLKYAF